MTLDKPPKSSLAIQKAIARERKFQGGKAHRIEITAKTKANTKSTSEILLAM
jgi:hypothetical protein